MFGYGAERLSERDRASAARSENEALRGTWLLEMILKNISLIDGELLSGHYFVHRLHEKKSPISRIR
jgi:uncharacterized membrane protein